MKTLSHRSIAKVHKYFKLWDLSSQKPLGLCIIMDYVQGDTLREVLRRLHSPFPKIFVMEWFIRILEVSKLIFFAIANHLSVLLLSFYYRQ